MKKISFALTTTVMLCMFLATATAAIAQSNVRKSAPSASFERIWIDYDVMQEGRKGMLIHTDFKVFGMRNVDSYLAIYFQTRDGKDLMDTNGAFDSETGRVSVFRSIKPESETTEYEDLEAFMPYDELDLEPGLHELRMDVDVIYEDGKTIQHLTFYNFDFTKPGKTNAPVKSSLKPSATFERAWVDYDVTENGKYGMRIHVKFKAYSMKGVDAYLAIYFSKSDGTRLLTNNINYRSTEGQIAIYNSVVPGYDPAEYADFVSFMPYEELSLARGTHNLTMEINLIHKKGGLIQKLTDYDFQYIKP